jgi:hypothetical protein
MQSFVLVGIKLNLWNMLESLCVCMCQFYIKCLYLPLHVIYPVCRRISLFDQHLLDPNILLTMLLFVYSKLFCGFMLNYV